jgi:hypothetical protein
MSLRDFIKELKGNGVEGELVQTIFVSLITSFVLASVLYYIKLRYIQDFLPKYGFFLFFALFSYALILPSVRHVRAYKNFTCMSGMMIGMTLGMIAGFLSGFFIGATNGMFWGSIYGMAVGISLGVWNGKCCGIMGAMEGIMAGFMGSLMGGMTAVMMLNDNLKIAGVIVFLISGAIIFGLHLIIYKEMKGETRARKEDQHITIALSFILTLSTIWLMVFGPRSLLFQ